MTIKPTPEMLIESIKTELRLFDQGTISATVALSWIQLYLQHFKPEENNDTIER